MTRKSFYKQSAKVNATSTTTLYEIEKPMRFTQNVDEDVFLTRQKGRWGTWFFSMGFIIAVVILISLALTGWWYIRTFEKAAGIPLMTLVSDVWKKRSDPIFSDHNYKTFLLLGLDQSSNQRDASLLTDTLMLATVKQNGTVNMVSLPRDLWIDSLKTKINALYYYGHQTNPDDGITLVSSVVSEITGFPIDYYVIINMDTVKMAVDAIGGVDVVVERAFEDKKYPREIDIHSSDPTILYETVRFEAGKIRMNGETALKYIRSRHSVDPIEGTDEGREQRQQILLSSLKKQLMSPAVLANPTAMGALFNVWNTAIETNVTEAAAFQLITQMDRSKLSVRSSMIPIQEASVSGLIYHPAVGPAKQWIYLPVDTSWNQIRLWLREQL